MMLGPYNLDKTYCVDTLEGLKTLPDNCVDCIVTSPPYWGMRDYSDLTVKVWGGDPDCEHEWGNTIPRTQDTNANTGFNERTGHSSGQRKQEGGGRRGSGDSGQFCQRCGAWRGQLGLEPTLQLYLIHMLQITTELKRVLKPTGTFFLNHGNNYGGTGPKGLFADVKYPNGRNLKDYPACKGWTPKCLTDQGLRLSLKMVDEQGWIKRNNIMWYKPNHMPDSVKDRFVQSYEMVFFFVKNTKTLFWYNTKTGDVSKTHPPGTKGEEGVDWEWRTTDTHNGETKIPKEDAENYGSPRGRYHRESKKAKSTLWKGVSGWFDLDAVRAPYTEPINRWGGTDQKAKKGKSGWSEATGQPLYRDRNLRPNPTGKNPGDVWEEDEVFELPAGDQMMRMKFVGDGWRILNYDELIGATDQRPIDKLWRSMPDAFRIPTQPFPESHFATFPEKLVERCILAGCPAEVCNECGTPRVRIVKQRELEPEEKTDELKARLKRAGADNEGEYSGQAIKEYPDYVGDASDRKRR
ncbi:MAG: DNA methyltransferase, partial [Methermicoccaceae archaeon]